MTLRRFAAMTEAELQALLREGPHAQAAFFPAKTNKQALAETLAALANADGGVVVLGVTSRGAPQAGSDHQALRELVVTAGLLTDPPLILPSPQVLETGDGAQVVVVQAPAGLPHVYSLKGVYWIRTGAQNRPLTTHELRRLLLERSESGFESQPVDGATMDDLDPARVTRYLDQLGLPPDEDAAQALVSRGCITRRTPEGLPSAVPAPTMAGLLLFGREPQRFVRSAEVICVRYAGPVMGDEFVRQDLGGTLADEIRQAEAFVTSNMRRGMRIRGLAREEITEYPLAVVREAIVNAIAHRDYSIRGEGIRVLMFSDRLEVYSPGRLPGHVTLANIKDERYSRNEAIVAVLSDLGYIERLGYGIDRMIATMQEAGLPAPQFEETAAGFRVILQSSSTELVNVQPQQQRWGHTFFNERQEAALAYVQQHGRITNSDLQALCSRRTPRNHPPGSGRAGGAEPAPAHRRQAGDVLHPEVKWVSSKLDGTTRTGMRWGGRISAHAANIAPPHLVPLPRRQLIFEGGTKMSITVNCQSMVDPIQLCLLKAPRQSHRSQSAVDAQWEALHYLGRPSYEQVVAEHAGFVSLLSQHGMELLYLPEQHGDRPRFDLYP